MRIAIIAVALAGCTLPDARPHSVVICHNANCARATDPFVDDTMATLDESLRLEYQGRPAIDGVEIDFLWDREHARCVFAHDLAIAEPAMVAADRVAEHLAQPGEVSWTGDRFFVKIELKPAVTVDGAPHTPGELAAHVACAFDVADRIIAAGRANGRSLELAFESEEMAIVRAVAANPRWPGKQPYPDVALRLITNVATPGLEAADLGSLASDTNDHGVDILSFHATKTPTGVVERYESFDVELMLAMFDAAPETFEAMTRFEPAYVVTSEALLLRRWEER